ncbi:MAG: PTS glucose transporter subunit IIA [Anaerolineaceae bacterium]|nr:PTS glucose transporter subunit IIA [Anaerolineaceae bacterium]
MFWFKKKKKYASPVNGIIDELEKFPDEAISEKMLGEGFYVEPSDGNVVSPVDGEVAALFPTGHAIGLKQGDEEILVHIGVDTVLMKGEGFDVKVKLGDIVKAGDLLVVFDPEKVKNHPDVKASAVAVLFTNMNKKVKVLKPGSRVQAGQEEIVEVE